jgi:hypothetical protein
MVISLGTDEKPTQYGDSHHIGWVCRALDNVFFISIANY